MASRLERLFNLLEQGQSEFLRKTAAYQIGEIVKTHPNELDKLLEKIKPLILNVSWDTRIAASQTIEYIINNLPKEYIYYAIETLTNECENCKKLNDFNIDIILSTGAILLGTDTEKYDVKDDITGNENIKAQRKLINQKLGIDVSGAANLDTTHLFTDEDLMSSQTSTNNNTTKINDILTKTFGNQNLSTKRKASFILNETNDSNVTASSESELSNEQTKRLKNMPTLSQAKQSSYSLDSFVKWLLSNLFSPSWETRHGAATSLRELLKCLLTQDAKQIIRKIKNDQDRVNNFIEDILAKLLTVIALDRFADYVGDEVIVPVRETCSQIVGIISYYLNEEQISTLLKLLLNLLKYDYNGWVVKHSSIIVFKYIYAANAQNDTNLKLIIELTVEDIFECIKDTDDDVRQVASDTLVPIGYRLNELLNQSLCKQLIKTLINVLSNDIYDDLTTSSISLMCLLSDLLTTNENNSKLFWQLIQQNSIITHILPYLKHSSLSVKQTTLNVLNKILIALYKEKEDLIIKIEKQEDFSLLFRLLYQQALFETDSKCCELIKQLWLTLCNFLTYQTLINCCYSHISTWLLLFMYPTNQPIDKQYLLVSSNIANSNSSNAEQHEYIGGTMQKYEEPRKRDQMVIQCRLLASNLLSTLFNRIYLEDLKEQKDHENTQNPVLSNLIIDFLCTKIPYKSGLNRFCFGLLMVEWGNLIQSIIHSEVKSNITIDLLKSQMLQFLDENATLYFDEIAVSFTRIQKECKQLTNLFNNLLKSYHSKSQDYDKQELPLLNVYTFDDALKLISQIRQNNVIMNSTKMEINQQLQQLNELVQRTSQEQDLFQLRSSSSLACASVANKHLTDKMNPLIRPLIDCIRSESNEQLQSISCKHLAILLQFCCDRQPNPVVKIFKNLLNSLCNDQQKTPQILKMSNLLTLNIETNYKTITQKEFYDINRYYGILSIKNQIYADDTHQQHLQPPSSPLQPQSPSSKQIKRRMSALSNSSSIDHQTQFSSTVLLDVEENNGTGNNDLFQKLSIEKRGAELTFNKIFEIYDFDQIEIIIPELVQMPQIIEQLSSNVMTVDKNLEYAINLSNMDEMTLQKYQEFINICQLIEHMFLYEQINNIFIEKYIEKFEQIKLFLANPLTSVRHMISRCISSMCKRDLHRFMNLLVEYLIEALDNQIDLFSRQGSIELVYNLLEKLSYDIVPYIVLLIVPVLKRMTDLDWYVRTTASYCFAALIKLYPLETSNELNQYCCNENILRIKQEQKDFLEQLCDSKKIKEYKLDKNLINADLRPYQQQGVNWLAFLKQFNLHGILCDDMGLGKTLQSIAILAGDYFEKSSSKMQPQQWMPSIIICPTTLTNHWYHEIKRFVDPKYLKPIIYSGSIQERENLKRLFQTTKKYNIFIVSYDIVRHDIQYISTFQWNYCILDEGHLIKSTKTKLSKAIKQISASHRLILTGTPIQNNVCELWCLFDFLIPGYLGTEKQFHMRYAKYIAPQSTHLQHTFERMFSSNNINTQSAVSSTRTTITTNQSKGADLHQLGLIALESLHKQVLPFLLRRTKEEVLHDLPPKIIQDYYCEMSNLQKELYEDFAKSEAIDNYHMNKAFLFDEVSEDNSIQNSEVDVNNIEKETPKLTEHVFQALQYLRKVVNHPSLVLKPDHPKWSKIQSDLLSTNTKINDIKHSGKLLALKDLLHECGIGVENSETQQVVNQHRVLIFCQLKGMIDIIENELLRQMDNVSYLRLDGSVPPSDRYNIVSRFNSDPSIDILLLTTSIGGLGLNLTGADTVIFVEHDWNPTKDLQAMDRAHRIGQTKIVNVYRLITKRSLEEKIMSLQKFKMGVANSVVNIDNSSLSSMGTEQLLDMFSKESTIGKNQQSSSKISGDTKIPTGYQKFLENLTELWDEKQYESEYNLDAFIKSLNNN